MNTDKPYDLETYVPHFGRIKAVRRGEMEYEYLLTKAGTTSWLSHADITAAWNKMDPEAKRVFSPIIKVFRNRLAELKRLGEKGE